MMHAITDLTKLSHLYMTVRSEMKAGTPASRLDIPARHDH
jgi:hypothetical protein